MSKKHLPVKGCEECEEFKTICIECLDSARAVMTKQDIIDQIKEIVVDQCELEPEQRQWFAEFGALIDKIEHSIKEEQA